MERLTGPALRREQERTLSTARLRYGLLARLLFVGMDAIYGRRRTLSKFKVLELIARVPYQAWEQVAYVAMTHTSRAPDFARRIFDRVRESRQQQDNEQWHLLILEDLIARRGVREGFIKFWLLPQLVVSSTIRSSGCCTCSGRRGPTPSMPSSRTTPSRNTWNTCASTPNSSGSRSKAW